MAHELRNVKNTNYLPQLVIVEPNQMTVVENKQLYLLVIKAETHNSSKIKLGANALVCLFCIHAKGLETQHA